MEINITFRNVRDIADIPTALLALGGAAATNTRPAGRARRGLGRPTSGSSPPTAANRRSPTLLLTPQELDALQGVHARQDRELTSAGSTDLPGQEPREPRSIWRTQQAEAARPKIRPQPFTAFQRPPRQHQGRTLSPRPYYRPIDQVGAADVVVKATPTSTSTPTPSAALGASKPFINERTISAKVKITYKRNIHTKIKVPSQKKNTHAQQIQDPATTKDRQPRKTCSPSPRTTPSKSSPSSQSFAASKKLARRSPFVRSR